MSKYDIHLFFTTSEHPFITTDNPVVIRGIEMEGAGFKGLFWFPISPYILISLSEEMKKNFERGFSEDSLKNARKFYMTYKDRIDETVFNLFAVFLKILILLAVLQCLLVLQ